MITVAELREALSHFPSDMPVAFALPDEPEVYRIRDMEASNYGLHVYWQDDYLWTDDMTTIKTVQIPLH